MKKSKPAPKPKERVDARFLDVRVVFGPPHRELADYIKQSAETNVRSNRDQIIYMLRYAAAQMSAHDQENMKEAQKG